jgi:hypothetical protein
LHSAKANVCREPGQTGSRQRVLKKKKKILPRARPAKLSAEIFFKKKRKTFAESMARLALSKEFFQKKRKTLCRESARWTLGKEGNGREPLTASFRCREPDKRALGKEGFADRIFADAALPRAALGKGFAEGLRGFAESLGPRQSSRLQ